MLPRFAVRPAIERHQSTDRAPARVSRPVSVSSMASMSGSVTTVKRPWSSRQAQAFSVRGQFTSLRPW